MPKRKKKNPAAVALGKLGGAKGGKARAQALSAKQRSEISRKGAQTLNRSLSKKERSRNARKAVLTRWNRSRGENG